MDKILYGSPKNLSDAPYVRHWTNSNCVKYGVPAVHFLLHFIEAYILFLLENRLLFILNFVRVVWTLEKSPLASSLKKIIQCKYQRDKVNYYSFKLFNTRLLTYIHRLQVVIRAKSKSTWFLSCKKIEQIVHIIQILAIPFKLLLSFNLHLKSYTFDGPRK